MSKKELDKIRKEGLLKIEELKRVEGYNLKIQSENFELNIEQLESSLREAESVRKEIQHRLEYSST